MLNTIALDTTEVDETVAPKWYVLCSTTSDEVAGDAEMTPEEADWKNSRFASIGFPWRWVAFSEKGQEVA